MIKNTLTGLGMFGLAASICCAPTSHSFLPPFCSCGLLTGGMGWGRGWGGIQKDLYTLRAVAQDEFEDVPMPSASSSGQGAKGPDAGGAGTITTAK